MLFGGELPRLLQMRISQMDRVLSGEVGLSTSWPDEASGLFQGIRKGVKVKILTKKDHLAAIARIPKHLMKDRVIGDTVECEDWFYTSVEHTDRTNKEASWFSVIVSAKNSNVLCFSYTW